MKDKNKIKIAGSLSINDWEELSSKLDRTSNELWSLAFNFFEQRITTRYLNPINQILGMDLNTGEGFAVVNLQCSLIETIESFHEGWIFKYENNKVPKFRYYKQKENESNFKKEVNGKYIFNHFFKTHPPFAGLNIDESFYSDVRCALLHETQTKNDWIIRDRHYDRFYEANGNEKIIYRTNFQTAIEKVIEVYKKNIIEGAGNDSEERRGNFKAKFDHICEVS